MSSQSHRAGPVSPGLESGGASARFKRQKERILDAATLSLNQKGAWGMTLQEVANALDLRTSSVTYYFKRREQLAAAVFNDSLSRLADFASLAAEESTPRERVARYVQLYFDQIARGLSGESRPFAILSEIRAMDEPVRSALISQYQEIFRTVRSFFGPTDTDERKRLLTARAHILNEALFWSEIWLPRFAIGDFSNVCQRLLAILDGGLVNQGIDWHAEPVCLDGISEDRDRRSYLRVATRLINDFGYKGASVERIAGELKRAKTTFYRDIEGKAELVDACSRDSYYRLAGLQRIASSDRRSAWGRIATTVSSALALQFKAEFPLLRSSAFQAMPVSVRSGAIERSERTALSLMGLLVGAMQEGSIRTIDPFIASHFLLSSIDASYDLKGWHRSQPLDAAIEVYLGVLSNGLSDQEF